ncbi:unnamed protein product [Moneuplotes crassus]|uniref:MORN repeat protein n=1 Tax=Euplotes crassus TaxID=5936 RepID=A0AAD2D0R4_EUPCR|nr:unnamed protein product [Moneuplotes crassus]
MGNCCTSEKEKNDIDVTRIGTRKVVLNRDPTKKGLGETEDDNKFRWKLDERLKKDLRDLYDEYKEMVEEEMQPESEAEEAGIKFINVQAVQEGVYEGGWSTKSNQRLGEGRIIYHNGTFHHGMWDRNLPNGTGLKVFTDGDVYFGEFVNGKMEGYGEYFTSDGKHYEGEFVRNVYEGEGTEEWDDGTVYKGGWKAGKKHGNGKLDLANGCSYEGGFKNGLFEGKGTYKYEDGKKYKGDYLKNKRHGYGVFTWPNGKIYEGHWVNGKQHGGANCKRGGTEVETEWKKGELIKA